MFSMVLKVAVGDMTSERELTILLRLKYVRSLATILAKVTCVVNIFKAICQFLVNRPFKIVIKKLFVFTDPKFRHCIF